MSSYILRPAALVFAMCTSLAAAASSSAQPRPYYDDYDNWQRVAHDAGYSAGLERGEADARDRLAISYTRDPDYLRADAGYRRDLTSLERYRNVFREGYATGYEEGYRRDSDLRGLRESDRLRGSDRVRESDRVRATVVGNVRRPASMNVGFEYGFADGYKAGLQDIRDRDRFNPTDHGAYRDGDRGYDRKYGEKDIYKTEYRDGFHAGYTRGYREGRP